MDEQDGEATSVVTAHHEWIKRETARRLRREMTPSEKQLWQHLRGSRLNGLHFHRQQVIDGFVADFYCHAANLVVEADGEVHQEQTEYDGERDQIFQQRGLLTLRFTNSEISQNIYAVTARIRQAVKQRLSPTPFPNFP